MKQSSYESDELLHQYLDFHYGPNHFGVANYAARCAELCVSHFIAGGGEPASARALELGCACGRTAFGLAKAFAAVDAIDLSSRFVAAAKSLQEGENVDYRIRRQGELFKTHTADLATLKLQATAERINFAQGDATKSEPGKRYDLIFAGNLLDRLAAPADFLSSIAKRLEPGGLFVISTPYTLMESFTPRAMWIGGYARTDGHEVTILDGMRTILEPQMERLGKAVNLPFVIRETERKFQHSIAEMTVWRKTAD